MSLIPSSPKFAALQEAYGLTLADGVEFPTSGVVITSPPPGSVQMLTPSAVHKIVAFEMICRANGIVLDYFVFNFFFRFVATNNKYTFSARRVVIISSLTANHQRIGRTSGYSSTRNCLVGNAIGQMLC
ncbi:unnamed protein product [Lactuca saligna]|uniref:Uncharacterized protein n=1 Tax=Lactuca saligna TaxID=75948 RepID=A0AA35Z7H4_LACSI|nr:unnamed protein product [Lactuca saligna]